MDVTDTDKLKRLAEAATSAQWCDVVESIRIKVSPSIGAAEQFRYIEAVSPEAIIALIAERDEAVALLRDMDGVRMYNEEWAPVAAFLARIDAKGSE